MATCRFLMRRLHVAPAPVVSTSVSGPTAGPPIGEVPPLPVLDTVDQVRLEAVGVPPSVASVSVPPSVPVFVRRNTLLTIHGNWRTISASAVAPEWLKRWVYGNHVARYLRLVATGPFSLLVTADAPTAVPTLVRNVTPKSIAPVTLDGLCDWAILKRDALHVYAGPSLNIGLYPVPRRILRRLARVLGTSRVSTGLAHWARWGYTFVSGRGVVGLVGHGLLYAASVGEGEELSVNRTSLVAVSVNGPYDLHNCVVQHSQPASAAVVRETPPPRMAQMSSWADVVINTKYYWWRVARVFRADSAGVLVGRSDFVRVLGPRTVLLQSGNPHQAFERNFRLPKDAVVALGASGASPPAKAADYLNIVTFDHTGAPSIQSTANFHEAVRAIEKKP